VCTAATCFLFVVVAGREAHADSTQQAVSSVFHGVFTAEQSARGQAQYLETCERCHKEDLAGDQSEEVPPLVGDKFLSEWTQWTVGDLFEFFTTKMPPKRKDRRNLSAETYADILAYILEKNGFPAGKAELLPSLEPLLEIEMSPSE
jgi:cytochrome c